MVEMYGQAVLCLISGFLQVQVRADREIPGWEIGVVRRTSAYIDPVRDTTIISGREICEDSDSKIVIVVESKPEDPLYRTAIRKTWADHQNVTVGFLVGVSANGSTQDDLKNESSTFRDIIQDSFVDSYFNLTLKGISILKWFTRTCPEARFLVKVDHDTFVNVPRLIQRLDTYRNASGVLRGLLCLNFDRDENVASKYYAPEYMYPDSKYPDFLQGSAYYMTMDVAEKLFKAALETPIFHLEDVYITGICAKTAGVKPENDEGILYLFGNSVRYCAPIDAITCNSVEPGEMGLLLEQFRGGSVTSSPFVTDEPIDEYSWPDQSFIYSYSYFSEYMINNLLLNDTIPIENTKNRSASLQSADESSTASSMKKTMFTSACVVQVLLRFLCR